jgi:histidine ammonia-lyase
VRAYEEQAMIEIGVRSLSLQDVSAVAKQGARVVLAAEALAKVKAARAVVERLVNASDASAAYGINTGFGALAEVRISKEKVGELQRNLVRSHAAGIGELLSREVVRAMMLLRAQTLALGHSGCRPEVIELLIQMLAKGVHPKIPAQGSVGASGDLAPLAHLALVLIGEGNCEVDGVTYSGADGLRKVGLAPVVLEAKEGLSLINGTQLMTALGVLAWQDARELCIAADITGALSLEVLLGTPVAFDPRIHAARSHPGQLQSADNLLRLTANSSLVSSHKNCGKVQDPYSLRCMPQVHGAARDGLAYVAGVLARELGAATDNPLIFVDGDDCDILSGGNFHGQPVAMALDFGTLSISALGAISERRTEQLMNPKLSSGLPPFLAKESGLHSGLMMAHVTAAALVSESKVLCHPASADSIPTSAAREDHVSMGPIAGRHFTRVVQNVANVLAIELYAAAQAVDLRAPVLPSLAGVAAHQTIRTRVAPLDADRSPTPDIEVIAAMILSGQVRRSVEEKIGSLL